MIIRIQAFLDKDLRVGVSFGGPTSPDELSWGPEAGGASAAVVGLVELAGSVDTVAAALLFLKKPAIPENVP